jgi:methenyltetrahydromethanopterin cyclohydrolase
MAESDEIRDARARLIEARTALDADIATLTDRLPAAATVVQAGVAGSGGLAAIGLLLKVLQGQLARRSAEKTITRETEIQAKAIATAIAAQREAERQAEEDRVAAEAARAAKQAAKAEKRAAKEAASADDDGGVRWGLLVLVAALVAAVVAYVTNQDDDDIWLQQQR